MRIDYGVIVVSIGCFVLASYFGGLSLQVADATLRVNLLTYATASFYVGIILVAIMTVASVLRRWVSKSACSA